MSTERAERLRAVVREWIVGDFYDGEYHRDGQRAVLRAVVDELGITRDDLESVDVLGARIYKHPPEKVYVALTTLLDAAEVEP